MKSSASPKPRSDQAFSSLRSRILDGHLELGTLLAEAAVARGLGVSRVTVREALFHLESKGLVEFSGTGRAYVKELSPQDFEELFILRETLEPAAARLSAPKLKADVSAHSQLPGMAPNHENAGIDARFISPLTTVRVIGK